MTGQFTGLALTMVPFHVRGRPSVSVLILLGVGVVMAVSAVWHNRPGNFHVAPLLKEGGQLIVQGPYRWVRHPMYSSLLFWGLGCVLYNREFSHVLGWLLLGLSVWGKAAMEEKALIRAFPAYQKHFSCHPRFFPHKRPPRSG